jgi:hypothetical protein
MTTPTNAKRIDVAYALIVDPATRQISIVGHRDGGRSLPGAHTPIRTQSLVQELLGCSSAVAQFARNGSVCPLGQD